MPHAYGRVLKIALQFIDKQIQNSAPVYRLIPSKFRPFSPYSLRHYFKAEKGKQLEFSAKFEFVSPDSTEEGTTHVPFHC